MQNLRRSLDERYSEKIISCVAIIDIVELWL